MRTVTVEARSTVPAVAAFTALTQLESFPGAERDGLAAQVLWQDAPARRPDLASVAVQPGPDRVSAWALRFGASMIRWQQRDEPAPPDLTLRFEQTAGDFASWRGSWRVSALPGGCHLVFEAQYAIGIPMYDQLVEPCAGQVVARLAAAILTGLFPAIQLLKSPAARSDPETAIWSLLTASALTPY